MNHLVLRKEGQPPPPPNNGLGKDFEKNFYTWQMIQKSASITLPILSVITKEDMRVGLDRKTHRFREETMARKRNQEYHKQMFWNDIKNYYKIWELQANKYNSWASQLHLHSSSTQGRCELQKHQLGDLLKRRTKLASLLAGEQKLVVDKELKTEEKLCQNLIHKCQIEEMRENNEEELMQEAVKDKRQQSMLETEQEMKLANLRKLENDLLIQMQEVKKKDKLSLELECLELHEIKLKNELEKLSFARNQKELERKRKDFCSSSQHQYQSQLKKRSKEIQARLEEDRQLIDRISKCFERKEIENSCIQEQARKEIEKANAVLAGHMHLEEERELETSFMFFEEARSMLQKQEMCWDAEQETRDAVIRDVLITIQNEVNKKLQNNAEMHKKLANEKEEILKNIEDLNKKMENYKTISF